MSDLESLFDFSDVPDLVAAWPCLRPCSVDIHEGLAPRGAYALWAAAGVLGDEWRERLAAAEVAEQRQPGMDPRFEALPPIARRLATLPWLARFGRCFDALGEAVAAGDLELTCTGEEVAFQILLSHCSLRLAAGLAIPPGFETWPGHGDDFDLDLNRIEDIVCWDFDVAFLWDPDMDGIEADDGNEFFRTVNLHPRDWFEPFADIHRIPEPGPSLPRPA